MIWQRVNSVALIDCGVWVVLERHLLTQRDEDAGEEQGQEYLHQSYKDLTFLESRNGQNLCLFKIVKTLKHPIFRTFRHVLKIQTKHKIFWHDDLFPHQLIPLMLSSKLN